MNSRWIVSPLLLLVFVNAAHAVPGLCGACDGWATWCAWQRTWHKPYVLETPLRDYYIPRTPVCCEEAVYADGVSYLACGAPCGSPVEPMAGPSAHGETFEAAPPCVFCDPGQFERLGQIPNDLELSIGAPASASSR